MSEIKNYIILSFKGENKEVKLPSNFDELKKYFLRILMKIHPKFLNFFISKMMKIFLLLKKIFQKKLKRLEI